MVGSVREAVGNCLAELDDVAGGPMQQGLLLCNEKLHTDDPYGGFKIEIAGDAEKVMQMIKFSIAIGTTSRIIMCSTCSFY